MSALLVRRGQADGRALGTLPRAARLGPFSLHSPASLTASPLQGLPVSQQKRPQVLLPLGTHGLRSPSPFCSPAQTVAPELPAGLTPSHSLPWDPLPTH